MLFSVSQVFNLRYGELLLVACVDFAAEQYFEFFNLEKEMPQKSCQFICVIFPILCFLDYLCCIMLILFYKTLRSTNMCSFYIV